MHAILTLRRCLAAAVIGSATFGACTSSAPTPAPAQRAAAAAEPTGAANVNIDALFPAGPGRDLVLNNCTSCHTFVPIVVLQMDQDEWARNRANHRERVSALSDPEFETLYRYLIANFNPDKPVPKLPKALLDTWTGY